MGWMGRTQIRRRKSDFETGLTLLRVGLAKLAKSSRHTCATRNWLRMRCGGRGSRTYRRTLPAANGLSRIFDDRGPLDGGHMAADSILDSLNPCTLAGRYGSYPSISPSTLEPEGRRAARPRTGLREVQLHLSCNACWPARKLLGLRGGAQASFRFKSNRAELIGWAGQQRRKGEAY